MGTMACNMNWSSENDKEENKLEHVQEVSVKNFDEK